MPSRGFPTKMKESSKKRNQAKQPVSLFEFVGSVLRLAKNDNNLSKENKTWSTLPCDRPLKARRKTNDVSLRKASESSGTQRFQTWQ